MSHLEAFVVPVCLILVLIPVVIADHRSRWRGRACSKQAEEKAVALLWEWLTPEQKKQWRSDGVFEVMLHGARPRNEIAPSRRSFLMLPSCT